MPVDSRIARRFVNAGQEPRVESSNLSVTVPAVDGFRQLSTRSQPFVVNCDIYVPWVCPRRAYFFLSLLSEPELLFIPERKIFRCGDAVAARSSGNIVCNERIYLSGLLLFPARRCVRARDLDHAPRSRNDRESKAVQLHNRGYQGQAETQA
jgi:hypothetical protein